MTVINVLRRIGGLEILAQAQKSVSARSPPYRRLRKFASSSFYLVVCSPPYRRLRKARRQVIARAPGSPPYRRLRNLYDGAKQESHGSPPYRRLRNDVKNVIVFFPEFSAV